MSLKELKNNILVPELARSVNTGKLKLGPREILDVLEALSKSKNARNQSAISNIANFYKITPSVIPIPKFL